MTGKYKVYVSRCIPQPGLDFLAENECELTHWDSDEAIPHKELVAAMQEQKYDALLCMLTDQVDAEVMDAAGDIFFFICIYRLTRAVFRFICTVSSRICSFQSNFCHCTYNMYKPAFSQQDNLFTIVTYFMN